MTDGDETGLALTRRFSHRTSAGDLLALEVASFVPAGSPVLALPRGGIPVAIPVARRVGTQARVVFAHKVGAPGHSEYAIGAVGSGGVVHIRQEGFAQAELAAAVEAAQHKLQSREERYAGFVAPSSELAGRDVVLVDDGMATGESMLAAVDVVRAAQPARTVVAVPVASTEALRRVSAVCDQLVVLHVPDWFRAVSEWYDQFEQLDDVQALEMLQRSSL